MSFSLTGKPSVYHNLTGKNKDRLLSIHVEVKKIKISILNTYLLPFLSKKWSKINENLFLLDQWKEKIDFYYKCFKIEELLVYKDILYILDVFMQQYTQLEDMEKKLYGTSSSAGSKEQIISMVYRTTMIKLKPEYELYDAILGKENRDANKNYKEDIIKDIQKQMILENTDFQKIKEYITNKYPKENILHI